MHRPDETARLLAAARGESKADIVLKGGTILDTGSGELLKADVALCGTAIAGIGKYSGTTEIDCTGKYIAPGLIDAHMHIESSMLTPFELSKVLARVGTTCVIADPHEAVNVCGSKALDYMLASSRNALIDMFFMIPSSVPATDADTNGCGDFSARCMKPYIHNPRILGLGEAMRVGDVISNEPRMSEKLSLAKARRLHIDGHFPGGTGYLLQAYRAAGIENDHESTSGDEAIEKLRAGFKVFIREGTAARDLDNIIRVLLQKHISLANCMFCTDDKHTEQIQQEGHISTCVHKAIQLGVDPVQAYSMGSYQTAQFYGLSDRGQIRAGALADILILDELDSTHPRTTIKSGRMLADDDYSRHDQAAVPARLRRTVYLGDISKDMICVPSSGTSTVIGMIPGEILTKATEEKVPCREGLFAPDGTYNKICVFERHNRTHEAAAAPLKGFGIRNGAIATSVSHDAHNIIAAGDNDDDIISAVRCIKEMQGGYAISSGGRITGRLALPICGLMSMQPCSIIETTLSSMIREAWRLGIREGTDPFTRLSFMALTVIPEIRITEKGIVRVQY